MVRLLLPPIGEKAVGGKEVLNMVPRILTVTYLLASLGSILIGPKESVIALGLIAALVTLPIFIAVFLRQILLMAAIAVLVTVLSTLVPPLGFLIAAWALVSLVMKFLRLARNLPPIVAGCGFYLLLFFLPVLLHWSDRAGPILKISMMILLPVAAMFLFHGVLTLLTRLGYRPALAASIMMGFPVYLTLFAFTFLLPSFGDVELGGDDGIGL
jgi:hypothetical protein